MIKVNWSALALQRHSRSIHWSKDIDSILMVMDQHYQNWIKWIGSNTFAVNSSWSNMWDSRRTIQLRVNPRHSKQKCGARPLSLTPFVVAFTVITVKCKERDSLSLFKEEERGSASKHLPRFSVQSARLSIKLWDLCAAELYGSAL